MGEEVKRTGTGKTESREQLGLVVRTAWPAVFESFFISLAGMIDTLMVSGIGAEAVAAVGLTTQPKFVGLALFFAINVAVSAIVARRKGENNRKKANEVLGEALVLVLGLGILVSVICVAGAGWIIKMCGSGADTHDGAVVYFQIIMGGIMFNILSMVINAAQRGAGNTWIAMTTNTISSVVNVFGNYVLIGGKMGFPKLGIQGAALATMIGSAVACGISIVSLFRKNSFLSMPLILREKLWKKFGEVKMIFRLASSAFVEQVLMRIGFIGTAVMAADMGTAAMAAHQVGMNALSLSFSLGDGMQAAAVTLIGQSLGANDKKQAKKYGMMCEKIGWLLAFLMSVFYFFFGESLYRLFFKEENIVNIGVDITRIVMIIVLFQISQVIFTGALRGAGDVMYTMLTSCVSVTFVRTIASYVFCYTFGMGINGIWWGIVADQLCRLVMNSIRFQSGKWTEIKI